MLSPTGLRSLPGQSLNVIFLPLTPPCLHLSPLASFSFSFSLPPAHLSPSQDVFVYCNTLVFKPWPWPLHILAFSGITGVCVCVCVCVCVRVYNHIAGLVTVEIKLFS